MDNVTPERKQVKRKSISKSGESYGKQPLSKRSKRGGRPFKTKREKYLKKMQNLYMEGDDSFELPSDVEESDNDNFVNGSLRDLIVDEPYLVPSKEDSRGGVKYEALKILADAISSPISYTEEELRILLNDHGYRYSIGTIRNALIDGTMESNGLYPLLVKKANKRVCPRKDGAPFGTIEMLIKYMGCGYQPVFIDECRWYTGWKWRHYAVIKEEIGTGDETPYALTSFSAMGPSGAIKILTLDDTSVDIDTIDSFMREIVDELDGKVLFFMENVPNRMEYTIKRIIEYSQGKTVTYYSPYSGENAVYKRFLVEWRNRVQKNYEKTPSKKDLMKYIEQEFLTFNGDFFNELIEDIRQHYNNIVLAKES